MMSKSASSSVRTSTPVISAPICDPRRRTQIMLRFPFREFACRAPKRNESAHSLHRRKSRRPQNCGRHLLHDRPVLLAFSEDACEIRILREGVELRYALVQALPREHVDKLVIV